jgi:hypothetical protein
MNFLSYTNILTKNGIQLAMTLVFFICGVILLNHSYYDVEVNNSSVAVVDKDKRSIGIVLIIFAIIQLLVYLSFVYNTSSIGGPYLWI